MATTETARTQFTTASDGVRYAYRTIGPLKQDNASANSPPLVLHIHYRANMDFWDPLLVNTLAAKRKVVIFDNAGVLRSSGEVSTTFQGWADSLIAFVKSLGLKQIDLGGFSMGGAAVQQVALTEPDLVRKLIALGTTPSAPDPEKSDISGIVWPRDQPGQEPIVALSSGTDEDAAFNGLAKSFFEQNADGLAHMKAYWSRLKTRSVKDEPLNLTFLSDELSKRQRQAYADWSTPNPRNSYDRLGELKMPVLVMNGDDDLLIPTSRSWELVKRIGRAKLVIYPRSGHGFLWQYAEAVGKEISEFLDGRGFEAKL